MCARDLARFALLSLQKGNWAGRQIVPEGWVEESTRAYSRSAYGSGYGYLWWTDFLGDAVAPTVTLPEGNFLAEGAGGQYALVGPTLDPVVHRVDRDTAIPRPTARSIAWLFWLTLRAEGYDPGPDASIGAATGERPKGENLMAKFLGRTISFGAKLKDGPYSMRFELDGRITYLQWDPSLGPAVGTWTIAEDQLCLINVRRRCFVSMVNGDRIELFGQHGVLQIDAVASPQ
jgi:hypothetical protein